MKYFITLLFLTTAVMAEEPPKFLKDANITVTLKDGKQYTFTANEWKVVPRLDKVKVNERTVVVQSEQNNRLTILGGVGPKGLNVTKSQDEITVENKKEGVFGLGYSRKITKRFSLGGQVISNGTYTLDLGVDF